MGKLITLKNCQIPSEATVIWSLLDQHGIPAWLPNWSHLSVEPHLSIALGGVPVLVSSEDEEDARALLDDVSDEPYEICPNCGGGAVERPPPILRSLTTFLIALYVPSSTPKRRCRDCNHRWLVRRPRVIHIIGVALLLFAIPIGGLIPLVHGYY